METPRSGGDPKHLQNQAGPRCIWGWLYPSQNPPETSKSCWDLPLVLSPCASQQWLTMDRMTNAGKKPMIM